MADRFVHLVGSVPLSDNETVFRAVGAALGDRVKRYPDGETGDRKNWIQWQAHVFDGNPNFALTSDAPMVVSHEHRETRPYYHLVDGADPESLRFPLQYARYARESYPVFVRLRESGVIPPDARFLVTMPAPLAFLQVYIAGPDRARVEPAYERAVREQIAEITNAVPARDLAFQWDTVFELLILEGGRTTYIDDSREALIARLARFGEAIPAGVQLGYHLCYGDMNHRHSIEPKDTALMVEVANALTSALKRPIDYVHMPVPRDRSDEAYFAPLAGLRLAPSTEVYLGLVHVTGGIDGIRKRIAAARRVREDFGIGTECGFGRRPPETIAALLNLHAEAARG